MHRPIDTRRRELLSTASERASAHRNTGMAACHRRSPVRSECHPFNCWVTKAATYGKAARRVTFRSLCPERRLRMVDRKSTRLNSSHTVISYAVFCLKKKKKKKSIKNHVRILNN